MDFSIRVSPDGKVLRMLYHDGLDFREHGTIKVVRASEVKFDEKLQKWYVTEFFSNGVKRTRPTGFTFRKDAIAYEISFLEKRLEKDPNSVDAMFEERDTLRCS